MKNQTLFPDLSKTYTTQMADNPVVLDGQKVLFDKKVTLLPIVLEKNTPESYKNGNNKY